MTKTTAKEIDDEICIYGLFVNAPATCVIVAKSRNTVDNFDGLFLLIMRHLISSSEKRSY